MAMLVTVVWVIRAGPKGSYADDFERHGVVGVALPTIGSVAGISPTEVRQQVVQKLRPEQPARAPGYGFMLYRFAHEIAISDLLVTPDGVRGELLFGRVWGHTSSSKSLRCQASITCVALRGLPGGGEETCLERCCRHSVRQWQCSCLALSKRCFSWMYGRRPATSDSRRETDQTRWSSRRRDQAAHARSEPAQRCQSSRALRTLAAFSGRYAFRYSVSLTARRCAELRRLSRPPPRDCPTSFELAPRGNPTARDEVRVAGHAHSSHPT